MSIFETIAIQAGRCLLIEEHFERLDRASRSVGWGPLEVATVPLELSEGQRTGVVRIYVTAGPGRPGDGFRGAVYALFEECEVGTEFPPVRLATSCAPYLPAPGGWKTGNYWQNVHALTAARNRGVDDGLLFNPSGALVCASMANIFLEVGGVWKTPPLETGARDGVLRAWILRQAGAQEALLGPEDAAECTGAFLTNSRIGVRAVSELDGRPLRTDVSALQRICHDRIFDV
ncbi:MAG: aminotransferase class IV [Chthoniobacterales bacterium]|nr:aminotransferase class IV [Chthoniobacterales bacterium]